MRRPVSEPTLAQLRRDRLMIWLWLPVGGLAMLLVVKCWQAFAGEPPPSLYTTLDVVWIVVTFLLIWRNSSRRCPKCDHRYLRSYPWMSLKQVRCTVCGHELH
jgi:DNA-directed RNA polymerase subunit RPC12/RpoP